MYICNATVTISWVGDGIGPLSTAPASPTLKLSTVQLGGPFQVPGGNGATTGNLTTVGTTIGAAIGAALGANAGEIQGWATGTTQ